jgi:hypothetical protein
MKRRPVMNTIESMFATAKMKKTGMFNVTILLTIELIVTLSNAHSIVHRNNNVFSILMPLEIIVFFLLWGAL